MPAARGRARDRQSDCHGSWSVAASRVDADGQELPLDMAIANLKRIIAVSIFQ